MIQHACDRPPELIHVGTEHVPATVPVGKRHHPVDAIRQWFARITRGDQLGRMSRTVAGRHHRDVIPRTGTAVLARIAEKPGGVRGRRRQRAFRVRKLIVELDVLKRDVVRVDVPPGFDGHARASHHLPVADDAFALSNRP